MSAGLFVLNTLRFEMAQGRCDILMSLRKHFGKNKWFYEQNEDCNMKCSYSALSGEREPVQIMFEIYTSNFTLFSTFSFERFLTKRKKRQSNIQPLMGWDFKFENCS